MSEETSSLSIPCYWDKEIIDQIVQKNANSSKDTRVKEVYGVLAEGGPLGHGRSRNSVVAVTPDDAIDYRKYLGALGFKFTYLLNAPFKFANCQNNRKELDEYLEWILRKMQPDGLMISSYELMRYLRDLGTDIPIYISTIAGVKTIEDIKKYLDIHPSRVVAHHDLGKEWPQLSELLNFCKKLGIEGEMLVTESCLYGCPSRTAHYEYLANRNSDASFHTVCNARKLIHPREFLMAGGTVRPEDISLIENIGVKHIKISGRSKPPTWLPEVVSAYLERRYQGNLLRLLGIDPSIKAENWIYLNNQTLDGFLINFPFNGDYDEKAAYCDGWIIKLYQSGDFKLLDGSSYMIKNDSLTIDKTGEKARDIIQREMNQFNDMGEAC